MHTSFRSHIGKGVPKLRFHLLNTTLRSSCLHVFGGLARDWPRSSENLIAENAPHNTHLSIGPPVLFDLMYIPTLGNQTAYLAANERYPALEVSGGN